MNVMELLTSAVEKDAADIFLIPGMPFSYKIGGRIIYQGDNRIMPDEMNEMIKQIYELAKNRSMEKVQSHGMMIFPLPFQAYPGSVPAYSARGGPWPASSGWYGLNFRMPDSFICQRALSMCPG